MVAPILMLASARHHRRSSVLAAMKQPTIAAVDLLTG